jgi:hypothetical protein
VTQDNDAWGEGLGARCAVFRGGFCWLPDWDAFEASLAMAANIRNALSQSPNAQPQFLLLIR